eukprot:CAMPEP_0172398562 /NCGR_PEP_ID=MMETSP1061-20121228/36838_1 /TAXON_ID=37318 /ORGANISM="Pseudo-nitzschia pungens, Strain cf. pungens" /LENGTH=605 /DNA_ID=CAMNT_0013131121 /DNA_START=32 /DNA_END=1849 /DNA_ORIENTATION=+
MSISNAVGNFENVSNRVEDHAFNHDDPIPHRNMDEGISSPTPKKYRYYVQIDDAIERIGTGTFQYQVLFAAGLCFMADAMEVLLLSFLSTVLKHEWDLSEHEVDSIVAVVFAGALLGTLILGQAADKFGRKPVFAVTSSIIAVSGVATAFCRNFEELIIARFFVGFGVGGLTVPFDTLSEFLPNAARGKSLLYIEFFWTMGTLIVPMLAYLTLDTAAEIGESHWQLFVILCSIPCFVSTILGMGLVPESPRWLLEKFSDHPEDEAGSEKALQILRSAALKNGISRDIIDKELFPAGTRLIRCWKDLGAIQRTQSPIFQKNNERELTKESSLCCSDQTTGDIVKLFSTPEQSRVTMFLWATWFGFGFLYYGVIIAVSIVFTTEEVNNNGDMMNDDVDGASSSLSYGFDFAAIFITASSEIFGLIAVLYTVDKFGRIPSQTVAYRVGGAATFVLGLFATVFYAEGGKFHRYLLIGLAFIARMAMMAASCTTWVATTEILSTDIRTTGHGTANAMARLGGFLSPYFVTESNSLSSIGGIMLAVSVITAECAQRLPETAGKSMGDISETEIIENSIFVGDNDTDNDTDSKAQSVGMGSTEHSTTYHELS